MWSDVRRELRHLDWEATTTADTGDLLTEWSTTISTLEKLRRALGPDAGPDDPFTLLATASRGAMLAGAGKPDDPAPRMERLQGALADVTRSLADASPADQARQRTAALQVTYELSHRVRTHAGDDLVRQWLLAGETAIDAALHAPAHRTPTSVALAAWQGALVAVQHQPAEPSLRRGLALGHAKFLRTAHDAVTEAARAGALPADYSQAVLDGIRELAHAHQAATGAPDPSLPIPGQQTQAVMLRLGTAVRQLTGRPDPFENPADRLDALLRTGIGQAALVAGLTADPAARAPADRLQRLALEYLATPRMLQRHDMTYDAPGAPVPTPGRTAVAPSRPTREPIEATIAPGTILDGETVAVLCRTRDLGAAASTADPARPPAILRGTDPADWPRLARDGQQAVADLVASVTPMVYAMTRRPPNIDDMRGEMFVHLMRIAHSYDPTRAHATRWPTYAWETLQHLRWRGVDNAGVPRYRGIQPPGTISLDRNDPVSPDPHPGDIIDGQAGIEAARDAVNALPTRVREPLLLAMAGQLDHQIAGELGISAATVHRRIDAARKTLHQELDIDGQDDEIRRRDYGTRHGPNHSPVDLQQVVSFDEPDPRSDPPQPRHTAPNRDNKPTSHVTAPLAWETVPPIPEAPDAPFASAPPSNQAVGR